MPKKKGKGGKGEERKGKRKDPELAVLWVNVLELSMMVPYAPIT